VILFLHINVKSLALISKFLKFLLIIKTDNFGFLDNFYTIEITEKAMWIGSLKGIIVSVIIYSVQLIYLIIVYFVWTSSYNQARFFSAQQYINNQNAKIKLLYQRTSKVKNKLQGTQQENYSHEYEEEFLLKNKLS